MPKPNRKLAPQSPLKNPEDAICKITGCGRVHATRMVKVIGKEAAGRVLQEAKKKNGKPRLELQKAYSASTAPSPHQPPPPGNLDDTDVIIDS